MDCETIVVVVLAGMRLTFVVTSLDCGGAQGVCANMANYWAEKGWTITVLTFSDEPEPFYRLHSGIRLVPMGISGKSGSLPAKVLNNRKRILRLRAEIQSSSPEAVISFMTTTNVLTLLAVRGRVPVLVSEHSDPKQFSYGRHWDWLRDRTYPRAFAVVVLNQTLFGYYSEKIRRRAVVIPNPVLFHGEPVDEKLPEKKRIVALGRLSHEKGFDLLLQSFARIASRFPEWSLTIWGDGPARPELEALRRELGLEDRVALPGFTDSPLQRLKEADVFVLPSRREAFGVALCEAMACGLAVVSVDCPVGPRDIIRDGVDGILVPPEDPQLLAEAMARLIERPEERLRLARRAPEVLKRFGIEKVMADWEMLLQKGTRDFPS